MRINMNRAYIFILYYLMKLWRLKVMTKSTAKALKGLTAGVATGMLVGYMGKNMTDNKKQIKKKANKAMETFGDVIDTVSYMFK